MGHPPSTKSDAQGQAARVTDSEGEGRHFPLDSAPEALNCAGGYRFVRL